MWLCVTALPWSNFGTSLKTVAKLSANVTNLRFFSRLCFSYSSADMRFMAASPFTAAARWSTTYCL